MNFVCLECGTRFAERLAHCAQCWREGLVVPRGERTAASVDHEPAVMSARALARTQWQQVELRRQPGLRVDLGAIVVLVGPPGAGKSSLLAALLDGLNGPVVLMSTEEAPGPTLASRLLRAGVKRADFYVTGRASIDQVVALVRKVGAIGLGVDSIQPALFTPGDLRHLLAVVGSLELIACTSRVNAGGTIYGGRELEHEADVVLEVEDRRWKLAKSRYQDVNERIEGEVQTTASGVEQEAANA